jgi:hypothetical protein
MVDPIWQGIVQYQTTDPISQVRTNKICGLGLVQSHKLEACQSKADTVWQDSSRISVQNWCYSHN